MGSLAQLNSLFRGRERTARQQTFRVIGPEAGMRAARERVERLDRSDRQRLVLWRKLIIGKRFRGARHEHEG